MKILLRLCHAKIPSVVILSFTELPHHHLLALFPFPFTVKVLLLERSWALYWLLTSAFRSFPRTFFTLLLDPSLVPIACPELLYTKSTFLKLLLLEWHFGQVSLNISAFLFCFGFFNYKMLKGWFLFDVSKFLIIDSDAWLCTIRLSALVFLSLFLTLTAHWKHLKFWLSLSDLVLILVLETWALRGFESSTDVSNVSCGWEPVPW